MPTVATARAVPSKACHAGALAPRPAPSSRRATLTLSSKNYSSWSLRGWLMARFAGLDFDEVMVSPDDADARKELLLLAPSIRVPCLTHDGTKVWNTLAIAQYLHEIAPEARAAARRPHRARAHCRSICGEMNSGFANLRSALPMNLKGALSEAQGSGAAPSPTSSASSRSGASASPRYRRAVPVRQAARHGRRDVRAGGDALPHLRRDARPGLPALLRARSWRCPRCRSGSPRRCAEPDEIDELDMEF